MILLIGGGRPLVRVQPWGWGAALHLGRRDAPLIRAEVYGDCKFSGKQPRWASFQPLNPEVAFLQCSAKRIRLCSLGEESARSLLQPSNVWPTVLFSFAPHSLQAGGSQTLFLPPPTYRASPWRGGGGGAWLATEGQWRCLTASGRVV